MGAPAFLSRERRAGDQTGERERVIQKLLEPVAGTPDSGEPPEGVARLGRWHRRWSAAGRRRV
jgi:hypothetical protein